jgi:hypothetical protein
MAPMLRNSGVGPLIVRTGSSWSSNEHARTPRAARCKTVPRIESLRPAARRQVQHGIDQTVGYERVQCVNSQRHFESVSTVKFQRPTRGSSITREATDIPSRIHRTPATEMLEVFQTLKFKGSQNLEPRLSLFDHRSSLFLTVTQDIEIYDTEYERPLVCS